MAPRLLTPLLLAVFLGLATPRAAAQSLTVELVAKGMPAPTYLTSPPLDSRLFVLEQNTARIRIIKNGQLLSTPFLDLKSSTSTGGERGLLGLAFHPDYANNGRFFVNRTGNSGNTRVAEFKVSAADPDVADPGEVQLITLVVQPFTNHNGGCLQFGPDGMLYVGMGDGGSGNDPGNRAQDLTTNLGKLLRFDVDLPPPFIPGDNPFVNDPNANDEIWAYGLRNPWRFSFDRVSGDLWIADVGQNAWEEINFVDATSTGAENYGWRCMEGLHCTGLSGCTCNDAVLTLPIHEYGHGLGCSVTGGYAYQGPITFLQGTYFFSDFCSSRIWSFRYDGQTITEFTNRTDELEPPGTDTISSVSSFGEDAVGNLYILDFADGEVWRIIEAPCSATNYCQTAPNSAGGGATISDSGSRSLTDNQWMLHAQGSVPGQFGIFYYGDQQTQVVLGDGFRCVDGTLVRILPPFLLDAQGQATLAVDFAAPPFNTAVGQVMAGTPYYFQHWYRDPGGPGGTNFNFSDGLEVVFCP